MSRFTDFPAAAGSLSVLFATLLLSACATSPSPIASGTDTDWSGNLTSGSKFGMAIGRSAADARDTLWTEGFGYQGAAACDASTRVLFACRDGDAFLMFQPVDLGRKGNVYLKIDGGNVAAIGWDLKPVSMQEG